MAAGLPYAIGAAVGYPGRQVVVFTSDGLLTMQLGGFLTAVRHARLATTMAENMPAHRAADGG